jgi:hypothetical protein
MTAIGKAGLAVAVVFQFRSGSADSFRSGFKGEPEREKLDAVWALKHAEKLDQPLDTPIYFGADFNLQDETGRDAETRRKLTKANEDAIKRYFTYIANELGKKRRKVGVYGCGATCRLLRKHALAEFFWISESMSYLETDAHYNKDKDNDIWHLYQNKGNIPSPFPSRTTEVIDTNVVSDQFDWFGQWDKDGKRVLEPKDISTRVLGSRRFVRTRTLCLKADLSGPEIGSAGLLPKEKSFLADPYARTVRVLCDAGDYVGVSLTESDKFLGYCKKAHLTESMRTMPSWAAKPGAGPGNCG